MDVDIVFSFLIALVIIIVMTILDEGFPLIILGFLVLFFTWNIPTIFLITSSSLSGWGNLLILIYAILSLFCFAKAIMVAKNIKKGAV